MYEFSYLDAKVAEHIMCASKETSQNQYALFCYLSASFRAGHLFVEIADALLPDPKLIFECEDTQELEAAIRNGFEELSIKKQNRGVVLQGNRTI